MTPTNSTISPFTQLTVESLSFSYHSNPALQNLSFSAKPGELIAIVGPNGCGKSTLLKLLIGALSPTAGTISIDQKPLPQWSRIDIARRLALVPQVGTDTDSASSFGDAGFTVRQSVMMARYAAHVDAAPRLLQAAAGIGIFAFESPLDQQLATTALWNFDVHHLIDRHLNTLSGGERQRVALARALAQQTPILLLDEPTSALDLFHQLELLHHLQTLTSHGTLALLVTHDLNLALTHASRVLLLDRGTLIADGTPKNVLTPQTLHPIYHVQVTQQGPTLLFHRQGCNP